MTISWAKFVEGAGGGHAVFTFFVAGMPWAVSTEDITLTTTERRRMFGARSVTVPSIDGTTVFPADSLDVVPLLNDIGKQTIELSYAEGKLDDGSWNIEIADDLPGVDWTYTDRTVWGLEGLSTLPNPLIDPTIRSAILSQTLESDNAQTTMYIENDYDDRLYDYIAAAIAAEEPAYIWVGNELVIPVASLTSTGTHEFSVIIWRAFLRTKGQGHQVDTANKSIYVADAPINGIGTSRPCYVWAIGLDKDGNHITDPALIRHGTINGRIRRDGKGKYKVACDPWWQQLDGDLKSTQKKGSLRGYFFSRGDTGTGKYNTYDYRPNSGHGHMAIWEFNSSTYTAKTLWLCDNDSNVYFDTYSDLEQAVQNELDLMAASSSTWGSDNLLCEYVLTDDGLQHLTDGIYASDEDDASFVTGLLPWLLGWNPPNSILSDDWALSKLNNCADDIARHTTTIDSGFFNTRSYFRRVFWTNSKVVPMANSDGVMYMPGLGEDVMYGPPWRSTYIYQWGHHSDSPDMGAFEYVVGTGWRTREVRLDGGRAYFILPDGDPSGVANSKVYVDHSYDVSSLTDLSVVYIGSRDIKRGGGSYQKGGRLPTAGYMDLDSIDAANNALNISPSVFPNYDGKYRTQIRFFDGGAEKFPTRVGGCLFYIPAANTDGDPYPVYYAASLSTLKLSTIFKSFLDVTGGVELVDQLLYDKVADIQDETFGGARETYSSIDWDSMDNVCQPITESHYYRCFFVNDELNLMSSLSNELLLHGVMPQWVWDGEKDQYMMKFQRINDALVTAARLYGRKINTGSKRVYSTTRGDHFAHMRYNKVNLKFNYSAAAEDYKAKVTFKDPFATDISNGEKAMDVEVDFSTFSQEKPDNSHISTGKDALAAVTSDIDPITAEEFSDVSNFFINAVVRHMSYPLPVQRIKTNLYSSINYCVGQSVVITDATAINPFDGSRGINNWPALIVKQSIDYGRGECEIEYQLLPLGVYEIAPSVRIKTSTITDANNIAITDIHEHKYHDIILSGQTQITNINDLMFFDCYYLNPQDNTMTLDTDCGCSNYYCTVFEADSTAPVVYEDVEIKSVDPTAKTATLTKTGIGSTWNTGKEYVVIYADWDNANLQDCQKKYIYIANGDGILNDGVSSITGRRWI